MEINRIEKKLALSSLLLMLLFAASFMPFFNSTNKEKIQKTAILNPKYKNIVQFSIEKKGGTSIFFQKVEDKWLGKSQNSSMQEEFSNIFPVEKKLVSKFLENCRKVQEFHKISQSQNGIKKMELSDNKTSDFSLKFIEPDGKTLCEILFNLKNLRENRIYLRSTSTFSVFELQDENLTPFLNADADFWADPYIIPQNIFGTVSENDIQSASLFIQTEKNQELKRIPQENYRKLLQLHHGHLLEQKYQTSEEPLKEESQKNPLKAQIKVELGNTKEIFINAEKKDKNTFVLNYSFPLEQHHINYNVCLSDWTFSRILELAEINE